MPRSRRCLGTALGLGGLLMAALPLQAVEPGLWRFDIRYDFVGIPQTFPTYQTTQCLTPQSPIPDISRPGHECSTQLRGTFGQIQTWQIDCSTEWESAQGMGRVTFDGEKAHGDVHIQVLSPTSLPEFMVFYLEGQRLGDCKK